MSLYKTLPFVLTAGLLFAMTSQAEEVRIPIGESTKSWSGQLPRTGQTKQAVESNFGSPASKHGPTGEPPISYWEYEDYTVYFEHNHVIHTVVKRR